MGDFSRLEADTKVHEVEAEKEFKTFKEDSNMDKAGTSETGSRALR